MGGSAHLHRTLFALSAVPCPALTYFDLLAKTGTMLGSGIVATKEVYAVRNSGIAVFRFVGRTAATGLLL